MTKSPFPNVRISPENIGISRICDIIIRGATVSSPNTGSVSIRLVCVQCFGNQMKFLQQVANFRRIELL